jgi:hypothetical protein
VYLQAGRMPAGRMPATPTPGRVSYLLCAGALYLVVPCSVEWADGSSLSCCVCKQQCTHGSSVRGMLGPHSTVLSLASTMPPAAAVVYHPLCVRFCGAWLTVQALTLPRVSALAHSASGLCTITVSLLRMDVPSGPLLRIHAALSSVCHSIAVVKRVWAGWL